jgi:hypothetical protein
MEGKLFWLKQEAIESIALQGVSNYSIDILAKTVFL